jgi:hypothetical protein
MILSMLFRLAIAVLWEAASHLGRGLLPRRRSATEAWPAPRTVVVYPGAMANRRGCYEAWASEHGLAPTAMRGAELTGIYRGRATEMVTGLVDTPNPKSPEILLRVALEGIEAPTLLERGAPPNPQRSLRAMQALLEVDGVRDIGVTRGFVRLRFDAFEETSAFDEALEAFEHALAGLAEEASPAPYR